MRDFSFVKTDQPTMAEFNKRFDGIAYALDNLGNEYVWEKSRVTKTANLGGAQTQQRRIFSNDGIAGHTTYSDDPLKLLDGRGTKLDVTGLSTSQIIDLMQAVLPGKYVQNLSYSAAFMLFPTNAVISYGGNFVVDSCTMYSVAEIVTTVEHLGYVNNPNPSAYPIDDGYTYTAMGQLGDKVRMLTGSYTGTGTYGASNPCKIILPFKPKLIILTSQRRTDNGYYKQLAGTGHSAGTYIIDATLLTSSYVLGNGFGAGTSSDSQSYGKLSDLEYSWYNTNNADTQMNHGSSVYTYMIIG